jgi:hypothetical protein
MILFKPFNGPKFDLQCQHFSWKNVYGNVKNDIEKILQKLIYNFHISNLYGDEWDNLQSHVQ